MMRLGTVDRRHVVDSTRAMGNGHGDYIPRHAGRSPCLGNGYPLCAKGRVTADDRNDGSRKNGRLYRLDYRDLLYFLYPTDWLSVAV